MSRAHTAAAARPPSYRSVKDLPLHPDGAPDFLPVLGATADGKGVQAVGLKIPVDSYIVQFPADAVLCSRKAAEAHLASLATTDPTGLTGLANLRQVCNEDGSFRGLFHNSQPAVSLAVNIRGISLTALASDKERQAASKALNVKWMMYGGGKAKAKSLWAITSKDIPKGAELLYDMDTCAVTIAAAAAAPAPADRKRKGSFVEATPADAAGQAEAESGTPDTKRHKGEPEPEPESAAGAVGRDQPNEAMEDTKMEVSEESSSVEQVEAAAAAASCARDHPTSVPETLLASLRACSAARDVRTDLCVSVSDTTPLPGYACLLKASCPSFSSSSAACQLPEHGAMALVISAWSLSPLGLPPGYQCVGVDVIQCARSMSTEEVMVLQSQVTIALSAVAPFLPSFDADGVPHPSAALAVAAAGAMGETALDLTEGASTLGRPVLGTAAAAADPSEERVQVFSLCFPMASDLEPVPTEVQGRSGLRLFVHAKMPVCRLSSADLHHRFYTAFVDVARCMPPLRSIGVPREC
jgi:hypothetical protein